MKEIVDIVTATTTSKPALWLILECGHWLKWDDVNDVPAVGSVIRCNWEHGVKVK
jgi:hypothetical protein